MNVSVFTLLLLISAITGHETILQQHFDKLGFYRAMASAEIELVDKELNAVDGASAKDRPAYEGALLMKKAGLVSNSKNKLNLFKSGRNKLEAVIIKDSANAEWRFLRLMIQEHAPKILNYRREIDKDSQFISKFFKSLAPAVQLAVVDYSKRSKVLNPALLN